MSRIGIVAEFNPLHTGHKYIMDFARDRLGAESIVVALGNEFTQRGGIAMTDRISRASSAVSSGADLVVSMPVIASCASAEVFAECGVALLASCGCDKIVCGYEGIAAEKAGSTDPAATGGSALSAAASALDEISLLKELARILCDEPPRFRELLRSCLKLGMSFPAARNEALTACLPSHKKAADSFLKEPNNILALEYQKAIYRYAPSMELIPVKRLGAGYKDLSESGGFVSASCIRDRLASDDLSSIEPYLPPASYRNLLKAAQNGLLLFDKDLSLPLHMRLLCSGPYESFLDISGDLSRRIEKLLPQYSGFESFAQLVQNKSVTASRVRRCLLHILLSITDEDLAELGKSGFAPYLWILRASEGGLVLLKEIKSSCASPLFMSVNEVGRCHNHILQKDLSALDIYRAIQIEKSGRHLPTERERDVRNSCQDIGE